MDTVPYIPAAGFIPPTDANSTAHCIQPDLDFASNPALTASSTAAFPVVTAATVEPSPSPSSSLYKYRKDYQLQPSLRFSHPGLIPGPHLASTITHGVPTTQSITAADVLATSSTSFVPSPLTSHLQAQRESVYRSNRLHPLGRTPSRGHKLPAATSDPAFRFGLTSTTSDDAKGLIYAPTAAPKGSADAAANEQSGYYARDRKGSMKELSRGEEEEVTHPVHRAYDWEGRGIDPAEFRFGASKAGAIDPSGGQVKAALAFTYDEKETGLIDARIVHHANAARNPLGATRDVQSDRVQRLHLDPAFRFGVPGQKDPWDARTIVIGGIGRVRPPILEHRGKLRVHRDALPRGLRLQLRLVLVDDTSLEVEPQPVEV